MTLRTRSCYFLTKLVKALREGVVQYLDVIVPGVQGTVGWVVGFIRGNLTGSDLELGARHKKKSGWWFRFDTYVGRIG